MTIKRINIDVATRIATAHLDIGGVAAVARALLPVGDQGAETAFTDAAANWAMAGSDLYFDGAALQPMPTAPSPASEWSWVTKAWVFDLAKARDDAWERIKAKRDQDDHANLTWDGSVFQADATAQQAISLSAQVAREAIAASQETKFLWTLADNSTRVLTTTQMVSVFNQLTTRSRGLRDQATLKRAEVYVATTQADLDAIVISTTPRPVPVA
jgi:hypothetical protein